MDYQAYLKSEHWKRRKERSLKLAGHKCQLCGKRYCELHVHHLNYDRLGCETDTDLAALCKTCHWFFHSWIFREMLERLAEHDHYNPTPEVRDGQAEGK